MAVGSGAGRGATLARRAATTLLAVGGAIASLAPVAVAGQSAQFRGRVLTDTGDVPIAGATVAIDGLKLSATSDSLGNFLLKGITPGGHVIAVRKIGFGPIATRITFPINGDVDADLLLAASPQTLPEAKVEATPRISAKLMEFEERRVARAGGHFLTRADFEKRESGLTSDVIRRLPGLDLVRDSNRGSAFYVTGGRMQSAGTAFGGGNRSAPCFAAVVLDGIFVFKARPYELPFDINSVGPAHIAGMEFYASPATIPIKYAGVPNTCGLIVIWTR